MKRKMKVWIGWALFEDGEPSHCYGLHYICLTRQQAMAEMFSKNEMGHHMIVQKIYFSTQEIEK